eukprot:TRINITY_DN1212_c0_g1_i4.p1 TRINITY_DN1212_c0_g1~~TRINITY_DN1212_c0_g1_i4.p1  ORF type:complete len:534 (+),score=249.12 TRINITY_DN1212_c0_g1_i4:713-2314(+)
MIRSPKLPTPLNAVALAGGGVSLEGALALQQSSTPIAEVLQEQQVQQQEQQQLLAPMCGQQQQMQEQQRQQSPPLLPQGLPSVTSPLQQQTPWPSPSRQQQPQLQQQHSPAMLQQQLQVTPVLCSDDSQAALLPTPAVPGAQPGLTLQQQQEQQALQQYQLSQQQRLVQQHQLQQHLLKQQQQQSAVQQPLLKGLQPLHSYLRGPSLQLQQLQQQQVQQFQPQQLQQLQQQQQLQVLPHEQFQQQRQQQLQLHEQLQQQQLQPHEQLQQQQQQLQPHEQLQQQHQQQQPYEQLQQLQQFQQQGQQQQLQQEEQYEQQEQPHQHQPHLQQEQQEQHETAKQNLPPLPLPEDNISSLHHMEQLQSIVLENAAEPMSESDVFPSLPQPPHSQNEHESTLQPTLEPIEGCIDPESYPCFGGSSTSSNSDAIVQTDGQAERLLTSEFHQQHKATHSTFEELQQHLPPVFPLEGALLQYEGSDWLPPMSDCDYDPMWASEGVCDVGDLSGTNDALGGLLGHNSFEEDLALDGVFEEDNA